jgi:Fis family transcriptional regulator
VTLDANHFRDATTGNFKVAAHRHTEPLRDAVRDALSHYFEQLDGTPPNDLYELVMQQVEQPLFDAVMQHTGGNQSRAAGLLGISRSTLRKKLSHYGIE